MQVWNGIEEFVKVVEKGSFASAADAMGFSKSHISKHVKLLENRLGVTLIHRTTRQLKLTNQGREFFARCQAIMHDLEEAQAQLVNEVAAPRGHIRLTVAGAFGEDYISPIIAMFIQDYPDVSVDLSFSNRMVDLVEEQYDLAIRSYADNVNNINGERLYAYNLITAASPKYFTNAFMPKALSDLRSHNCLGGTLPHWRFKAGGRTSEKSISGNWQSNNGRALVHAAKSGIGIIQVPEFYIEAELKEGSLIEILPQFRVDRNSFWAVYPKSHHTPIKSQMLVAYLKEKLDKL